MILSPFSVVAALTGSVERGSCGYPPDATRCCLLNQPLQVTGDSDSPVVVVRDLDNNQLVYAPGRADFM